MTVYAQARSAAKSICATVPPGDRHFFEWQTASMLLPSGSYANAA